MGALFTTETLKATRKVVHTKNTCDITIIMFYKKKVLKVLGEICIPSATDAFFMVPFVFIKKSYPVKIDPS